MDFIGITGGQGSRIKILLPDYNLWLSKRNFILKEIFEISFINFSQGIQGSKYWNVEQRQYNLNQDDKTSNTCTGKILLPLQVNKSITFMLISGL